MKKILLLHGAIGSATQLQPIANKLKSSYDVCMLNFSGHGGNALPNEPFSIKMFAHDVLYYLDNHNIPTIDIFGYSMGGYVALYLAKHYPERIGKVLTLATKFDWSESIAENESKMLIPEKIEEKLPSFAQTLALRHAPVSWKDVLRKTSMMMKEMGKSSPLNELDFKNIEAEIMLSVGDKDKMVTIEETKDVHDKIKKSQFVVFPEMPHPIEQVNLDTLANAIKKFMN